MGSSFAVVAGSSQVFSFNLQKKSAEKSAAQAEESSIAQDIPEVVKKPLMQVEFAGWIGISMATPGNMMKEQGKLPSGYVKIAIENDHL